jgi:recombinational DNA repair ATPase RecF
MFEHIQNFLSCENVVIDNIKGIIVLVGRNGSGKTNILKAIQWAAESATSTKPIEYVHSHPTKISLVLILDNTRYRYQLEVTYPEISLNERLEIQQGEWQNLVSRQNNTRP